MVLTPIPKQSPSLAQVALIVDSAASLPRKLVEKPYIHVVPMRLVVGNRTFRDGQDMTTSEFYQTLTETNKPVTTSSPSPEEFLTAFTTAASSYKSIICLTVSPKFSSSFLSARTAITESTVSYPNLSIELIDSQSAAGGEALVATSAMRIIETGAPLDVVISSTREVALKVTILAFVDTLYYLWKGGRVPRVVHAGMSLLQLKPMLEMAHGNIRNIARPRTRRRAIDRLLEITKERIGEEPAHVTVIHANALCEASELLEALKISLDYRELFTSEFSPVMGAHTGPGLLGVAFWTESSL